MTIRANYSDVYPVSPDRAFEYLSDPTRAPEWEAMAIGVRPPGPVGRGSRSAVEFKRFGRFDVEVVEFEPGSRVVFRNHMSQADLVHEYVFQLDGSGTRIDDLIAAEPRGLHAADRPGDEEDD